ncbi:MAG: hypothetical protein KGS48_04835 [Bacteroidetes bacterium]|nr:hypothetical protein [Bacteroidota bacterium]
MRTTLFFASFMAFFLGVKNLGAQNAPFLGKWEVVSYQEQGITVFKKKSAYPQAIEVYNTLKAERARQWYGYDSYTDYNRRENRDFRRWMAEDSLREINRLVEMIQRPTFVVFFADSTLSWYTKASASGKIEQAFAHHFKFSPVMMSLDVTPAIATSWSGHSDVQILSLDEKHMTLYLPETAEVVELVRVEMKLP